MAESFTDPERHWGSAYKATNRVAVGTSAGFSRDRLDFYVPNDRPKRLGCLDLARSVIGVQQTHHPQEGRHHHASETRAYLSSQAPSEAQPKAQWQQAVRGHGAEVEIPNDWRRDALFGEDRSRGRHCGLLTHLALIRSALLGSSLASAPACPSPTSLSASAPILSPHFALSPRTDFITKGHARGACGSRSHRRGGDFEYQVCALVHGVHFDRSSVRFQPVNRRLKVFKVSAQPWHAICTSSAPDDVKGHSPLPLRCPRADIPTSSC